MSPFKTIDAAQLSIGMKILAIYRLDEGKRYYPARIMAINHGGTYSVKFIGGEVSETQEATLLDELQYVQPQHKIDYGDKIATHTTLYLRNGIHELQNRMISVVVPMTMHGESEKHTIVNGGFYIGGETNKDNQSKVTLTRLTLRNSCIHGIYAYAGFEVDVTECSITDCKEIGILGKTKNCNGVLLCVECCLVHSFISPFYLLIVVCRQVSVPV